MTHGPRYDTSDLVIDISLDWGWVWSVWRTNVVHRAVHKKARRHGDGKSLS
jgi:hypothetical protein